MTPAKAHVTGLGQTAVVLVDGDEGFRLMMNVDHVWPLAIGDAVEIVLARDGDGPARVKGIAA